MFIKSENASDAAPWVAETGREILRIGHSDRVIGKIIPDILRVIVETGPLELVPKAAIYLNDAAAHKAKLAGFYHVHWTQIETTIDPHDEDHAAPDSDALARILVPVVGPAIGSLGTLAFYASTRGGYQHMAALTALASDVATVVRAKLRHEESQPAITGTMVLPNDSTDGEPVLSHNVFELLRTTINNFPGGICVLTEDR